MAWLYFLFYVSALFVRVSVCVFICEAVVIIAWLSIFLSVPVVSVYLYDCLSACISLPICVCTCVSVCVSCLKSAKKFIVPFNFDVSFQLSSGSLNIQTSWRLVPWRRLLGAFSEPCRRFWWGREAMPRLEVERVSSDQSLDGGLCRNNSQQIMSRLVCDSCCAFKNCAI